MTAGNSTHAKWFVVSTQPELDASQRLKKPKVPCPSTVLWSHILSALQFHLMFPRDSPHNPNSSAKLQYKTEPEKARSNLVFSFLTYTLLTLFTLLNLYLHLFYFQFMIYFLGKASRGLLNSGDWLPLIPLGLSPQNLVQHQKCFMTPRPHPMLLYENLCGGARYQGHLQCLRWLHSTLSILFPPD